MSKQNNHTHQQVIWKTYKFTDDIDIIEKKCRICWKSSLYLHEKQKRKKHG